MTKALDDTVDPQLSDIRLDQDTKTGLAVTFSSRFVQFLFEDNIEKGFAKT